VGKSLRHAEQVLGPGPGEAVDRLVVVTDDAKVVTLAQPEIEQGLLEQVHILVLVDRERAVLRPEGLARRLVPLEDPDR